MMKLLSRRSFVRSLAASTVAASAMPLLLPSRLRANGTVANSRLRVGQIGCGRIARDHDMPGVLAGGLADIVAVCDVDSRRATEAVDWLRQHHASLGRVTPAITTHNDFHEMLASAELDAVVISTPDHRHAEPAVAAARAGKHIYLQKPFTFTHAEGVALREVIAATGVTLQVGSQQRSWDQFRRACEVVRSGRLGRIRAVEIGLPTDPTKPDDLPQPLPEGLDYERWLGPAPYADYTEQRVHPQNGYARPGWLRHEGTCLGMITGWGSHHFDTMHWALDCEHAGPHRVEGRGEFPSNRVWNVHGAYDVQLLYPHEVRVEVSNRFTNGLRFLGDEGWLFVCRDAPASPNDPMAGKTVAQPLIASDERLLSPVGLAVQLPRSDSHHRNWLECIRGGTTPLAPAPVAHRTNTACIVSWIAMKLGRPLRWDAVTETFPDDPEANALLSRPERGGYGVLKHG
jgi:myo-inositol 2-dehydrogenase / D-chiro-inositol 1-dehydrogenase